MDRRQLLRWGLGAGLAVGAPALLGGCAVSDPRVEEPAGRTGGNTSVSPRTSRSPMPPAPTPTFAGAAEGAESERRLAGLAAAALAGKWRQELGDRDALLAAIRDDHLAHATALLGAEPTTRPANSPATPVKAHAAASLPAALKRLAAAERVAAARRRTAALDTTGLSTLLWGSMAIAATSYADALDSTREVPLRKAKPPRPMPVLSDVEAMSALVTQLHAVNYGYPMAIGQLSAGPRRDEAIRQLRQRRKLRDSLVTTLLGRKAEIPIAEAAYVPTVVPRSNATAARLIQDLERRLAPFVGLWLSAVSTAPERREALDELARTVATARSWGAPLGRWPGWA